MFVLLGLNITINETKISILTKFWQKIKKKSKIWRKDTKKLKLKKNHTQQDSEQE